MQRFVAVDDLDADEDVRFVGGVVAVVELGDVALADQRQEFLVGARLLGQRHRQHGFALLADFGALGDEAQAVEVHVGAGGHGDQRLVLELVLAGVFLGAGDGQRAGRFEDRAGVLEDVLDRGADGVGVDQDHLVDVFLAQAEGFLADVLDRRAVGEQADLLEADALALGQRLRHGIGVDGLDADDLDFRAQALDVGGDAGDQPAAADAAEHGVDRPVVARVLAQDFHADGALAGDHVGIVEGMDEGELLAFSSSSAWA